MKILGLMAFNINGFMLVLQKDVGASLESSEAVRLQILYLLQLTGYL